MFCGHQSVLHLTHNYTISGAAAHHIGCQFSSTVQISTITVTIIGTPNFSSSFLNLYHLSYLNVNGQSVTWSGAATGQRYVIGALSATQGTGGSTTYFPGNIAGTTVNGSILG